MNGSFGKLLVAPLAALALAGFALAPVADAVAARGGGGGGGGGGRAAPAGGGAARQAPQANNAGADARTNDVRSTSSNTINASKNTNVNVNVNQNGGGWDNDYHHPVAGAMVVGATIAAIGSSVAAVPVGCVPVNYAGMVYQQCGGTWYQPQGSQFVVVNPPY